jgi:N-acetylmuramoyl-L-alanine amidase
MNFDTLVWHYTATYTDQDIGAVEIDAMHKARGWSGIGYNGVVRLNGDEEEGRPLTKTGSHVKGQNTGKLGFVYVGGLKPGSEAAHGFDTRTREQKATMLEITRRMLTQFPTVKRVVGHMDLAPTQCPAFDVGQWWEEASGGVYRKPRPLDTSVPHVSYDMVRIGDEGPEVKALQTELKKLGLYTLAVDGDFGPGTDKAVRAFQQARRLLIDGKVGPATWTEIFSNKEA